MTVIEGITPGRKHRTVSERRGAYVHHHEVKKRAHEQRQTVLMVIACSTIVVVLLWIGIMVNGNYSNPSTKSDKAFVQGISNALDKSDTAAFPNKLSNYKTDLPKQESMDEINKQLFPDLSP